jgi:outer membrane protein OmpA-like peptidoglycan-associated protein
MAPAALIGLLCVAGPLFVAEVAEAKDDYTNRIGVFLGGGAGKYVGGLSDHSSVGLMFEGGVRFGWLRHWEMEANGRFGKFEASTIPDGKAFHNQTWALEFNGLYNHNPDGKWNPQAWAGLGALFWQVVDVSNLGSAGMFADGPIARGYRGNGDPALLTDTNFAGNAGVGIEYNATPRLGLRLGVRSDWLWGLSADNTGASAAHEAVNPIDPDEDPRPEDIEEAERLNRKAADVNNFLPAVFFRVTWWFSERDSDGDGIPNSRDACMYEAEDLDGHEDTDGCPDADNDGDGILDVDDGCPDEAEDVDGFQDEDGCPDLDNDGDTIPDAQDACPDEAEDIDGYQDMDGCPDLDNDGDGVPDAVDQCPDTPVGIAVDSNGCPEVARIDTELILHGVTFNSGSSDLAPTSYATLDSVVMSLKAYPDVKLEVQGHTDSQGAADKNFMLSQERAESVVAYLVAMGIDSSRLTPLGYGEDMPVASNETPEGRAQNRRVTLVPIIEAPMQPDLESMDEELELDEDLQLEPDN